MFNCGRDERDTLDKGYTNLFIQDVTGKGRRGRTWRQFKHVRWLLFMPECLYEHANLSYYNTQRQQIQHESYYIP